MRIANSSHVAPDVYCGTRRQYAIRDTTREKAFSLPEVTASLIILALIASSVMVVINRSTDSAANSILRMHAFEVARENMETILSGDSVSEITEYGYSDRYPEIQWQTIVEAFNEPITGQMWLQAVCSAEYIDTEGLAQKVELMHWLTNLTEQQVREIMEEREKEKEQLTEPGEGEQDQTLRPDITREELEKEGFPPEMIDLISPSLKKD